MYVPTGQRSTAQHSTICFETDMFVTNDRIRTPRFKLADKREIFKQSHAATQDTNGLTIESRHTTTTQSLKVVQGASNSRNKTLTGAAAAADRGIFQAD